MANDKAKHGISPCNTPHITSQNATFHKTTNFYMSTQRACNKSPATAAQAQHACTAVAIAYHLIPFNSTSIITAKIKKNRKNQ